MAELKVNSLTTYSLTDQETLHGSVLTESQRQVIQNLLATTVEEKLALTMDPEHHLDFMRQDSYLRGQLDILAHILESDEASRFQLYQNVAIEAEA